MDFQRGLFLVPPAASGEVDPAAGEAAAHQRDRHYGESGGEEIGSFRRQGGVSGLGMSAGKVQDAGNSRLHRSGAALGGACATVPRSAHGFLQNATLD